MNPKNSRKKIIWTGIALVVLAVFLFIHWAMSPITDKMVEFTIKPNSSLRSSTEQIAESGLPVHPIFLELLARISGQGSKLKAGVFDADPNITPIALLSKIVRGDYAQFSFTLIEGWTFKQMRAAIAQTPFLQHETVNLSDQELLAKVTDAYSQAEGLFYPDTYSFPKGSNDLDVYKRTFNQLQQHLTVAWDERDPKLNVYSSPYDALIVASLVEKESASKTDRGMIAGVFVNRLRKGMMLQTDPSVIYGMGDQYQGKIYKKDLQQDTPYNTYTRAGLPPTPIAMVGMDSLLAATMPARTDALYFVARGDGTSQFSMTLSDHNRAVRQYIK